MRFQFRLSTLLVTTLSFSAILLVNFRGESLSEYKEGRIEFQFGIPFSFFRGRPPELEWISGNLEEEEPRGIWLYEAMHCEYGRFSIVGALLDAMTGVLITGCVQLAVSRLGSRSNPAPPQPAPPSDNPQPDEEKSQKNE